MKCAYEVKNNSCLFEKLCRYRIMEFFILKCLVLQRVTLLYYANKEIETLNRNYLKSIAAVFFSDKRIRLTASVLLPCLHSWLEYLSVKNQTFQSLRWERGSCSEHTWYPCCFKARHKIGGSRWSLFKTTYKNFNFNKNRSSCIIVVTATALRMPDGIKTHSQNVELIIFTSVFSG